MNGEGLEFLLQDFAGPVFLGIVGLVAMRNLFRREITEFFTFGTIAVLVAVFIYYPTVLVNIAGAVADAFTET